MQGRKRAAPIIEQIDVTFRIGALNATEADESRLVPVVSATAYRMFFRLSFEALVANISIGGFEDPFGLLKQGIDGDRLAVSAAWRQKVFQVAFRRLSLLHLPADDGKRPVGCRLCCGLDEAECIAAGIH